MAQDKFPADPDQAEDARSPPSVTGSSGAWRSAMTRCGAGPDRRDEARRGGLASADAGPARAGPRHPGDYGFVVDSVKVNVLAYVPVRSGSLALIGCLKPTATPAFDVGAAHENSVSGAPVTAV